MNHHDSSLPVHVLSKCPSCGSEDSRTIVLGGSSDYELRRCSACELTFADTYADWDSIYVEGYLKGETQFGLDLTDETFQEFLDFAADKRMRVLERHTGGPGTILDVGCGAGEVLRVALRRGWTATGVEPVEESAEMARVQGLDVHACLLEESGLPENSFDVVSAFHVLEHIPAGTDFLRTMARWARPGGLVFIEVPNFRSVHRRNLGSDWPGLRPLEHVAHYSPKNLQETFERAGLEPVQVRTMGFLWAPQTTRQMLSDLGQDRLARRAGRFPGFRNGDVLDRTPSAPLRTMLRGVQAVYDTARVGQVVVGVARAPS